LPFTIKKSAMTHPDPALEVQIQNRKQPISQQPDGPGKRIGKRGEIVVIGHVLPGGGDLFRQRIGRFQEEAGYWESRIGTVHHFTVHLFDDDTRIMISAIYDGDFLVYLDDVIQQAGPWFDSLMPGVWEGYGSASDPETAKLIHEQAHTADAFYAAYPDYSAKDIARMEKVFTAVNTILDAAS
jgi:hypothetical protein